MPWICPKNRTQKIDWFREQNKLAPQKGRRVSDCGRPLWEAQRTLPALSEVRCELPVEFPEHLQTLDPGRAMGPQSPLRLPPGPNGNLDLGT